MDMSAYSQPTLRRTLGPSHLVALGIGAIVGAGIFVVTGHAAASYAGPGVVISFAIAGAGCLLAGLCYAECAAMIPVAGSAYTYTYATFGPLAAWLIGWNLVLEYLVAAATIAVGWSGYFVALAARFGVVFPRDLIEAPLTFHGLHGGAHTGAYLNVPAVALVAIVTALLALGVRLSLTFNNVMVAIKVGIVVLVIVAGLPHVSAAYHTPFIPPNTGVFGVFGWSGVLRATGVVFFAYIGFDAVSVLAQEARNPQRDLPVGILGSLVICTALYILMSYVVTGVVPYASLNVPNPVSVAMARASPGSVWLAAAVNAGAVLGLASVVLVLLLAQSRVFYTMSRDGLIPPVFGRIHPRYRTPLHGTMVNGAVCAALAAWVPLDILGELISIGTLAAFAMVCLGALLLRRKMPDAPRPFRVPLIGLVAPLGMLVCLLMMVFLPWETWIRLVVWTLIGLTIYTTYGARRAKAHALLPGDSHVDARS
jgi:basic amino acid/polyamine antiporter, APA family